MNTKELIELLSTLPPDMRVVVRGYEDGVDDVQGFRHTRLILNKNKGTWYYGAHEENNNGEVEAVELWGGNE